MTYLECKCGNEIHECKTCPKGHPCYGWRHASSGGHLCLSLPGYRLAEPAS